MTQVEHWRWTESRWKADYDWANVDTITAGIDIGSVSCQAVILAGDKLYAFSSQRTGADSTENANKALNSALVGTGMELADINYIVGTGYGRVNIPFANRSITEISCHARGVNHVNSSVRTILDMGGQDCKVIKCDGQGKVKEFLMNDKCAAGTGRGIEVMADVLSVPIAEIGPSSLDVDVEPPPVSSTCVIFAKSEALGLLNEGWTYKQVLAAYCAAVAQRVVRLIRRIGLEREFAITGGIAKNIGVVKRVEDQLGIKAVKLIIDPQIAGALGAALFARDWALKTKGL